jgi:hypothetical protein
MDTENNSIESQTATHRVTVTFKRERYNSVGFDDITLYVVAENSLHAHQISEMSLRQLGVDSIVQRVSVSELSK